MFKIEKGIPAPPPHQNRGRWLTTLRQMKIGDSFEFPGAYAQTLRYSISQAKKRKALEGDFVVRLLNDDNARCWRVKSH